MKHSLVSAHRCSEMLYYEVLKALGINIHCYIGNMLCSKKEVGIINVMWKNQLLFSNSQAFCCNERLNFFRLKCAFGLE